MVTEQKNYPKQVNVPFDWITPSNFRCGDILQTPNGEQYTVVDVFDPSDNNEDEKERGLPVVGRATLEKLEKDERIKPELLDGSACF
jgi:hypothetical protein